MAYWLAKPQDARQFATLKRFDPRFWTVNFPRPMMASVVSTGPHALRVDLAFYKANDLCGLIWEAEDRHDHPLLAYETARDFRGCTLSFHWQSQGVMPLDAINGPVLTIEGRDATGNPRSWYVRLWNYANGGPQKADIALNFDAMEGGYALPADADPVWAGDVDRMFISLVPPGYTGLDAPLATPQEGWVDLSAIRCDGPSSVLSIGDVMVPPHGLSIATGYDDSYHLTPARLLRNALHLGYRGSINHYVGMSHYFRLEQASGGFYVSAAGGALNAPCAAWHADFAARAKALDFGLILSLSYELFDAHCWNDWKQRAWNGDPALTGWMPPSTLLSPAHAGAKGYLQGVARAFVQIAVDAGQSPRFQVGEPWWWVMPDGRICLYDDDAKAAFGGAPVEIPNVRSTNLSQAQKDLLDAAGALLAASTLALVAAVRADHPTTKSHILVFLPTVLDEAAPDLKRANVPLGWADPAFDVLQLEDYDWITAGNEGASKRGVAAAQARLGYPVARQHYLSGFVLRPEDKDQWQNIDKAAFINAKRGVAAIFIWALPQVLRDGFTTFPMGEETVDNFDDVLFPLEIGRGASVTPRFSTAIVTSASGREQRNADWASARLDYDAGPGLRSEADVKTLLTFFRARRGAAKAFRFRDPLDHEAVNVSLGTGDGIRTRFALRKFYGEGADAEERLIALPVVGSLTVKLDGVDQGAGWTLAGGVVDFTLPPALAAAVTASFTFDVPVRFAEDRLQIDCETFLAGSAASVPLTEVRAEEVAHG